MKEAAYDCPLEVADAIERLRAVLEKHYPSSYTFYVTKTNGKLIAAHARPLLGGNVRSKPCSPLSAGG